MDEACGPVLMESVQSNQIRYIMNTDNPEDIKSYLTDMIEKSYHVARYGTAFEFREYMVSKLQELEKELQLEEAENDL